MANTAQHTHPPTSLRNNNLNMFIPTEAFIKYNTQIFKLSNALYSTPSDSDRKLISPFCEVPNSIASVLVKLINKLFKWSQQPMACSIWIADTSGAEKNTTVSSAYMRILHSTTALGRSFRWRINNSGPNIDPCRTPTETGSAALDTPWNSTIWVRFCR